MPCTVEVKLCDRATGDADASVEAVGAGVGEADAEGALPTPPRAEGPNNWAPMNSTTATVAAPRANGRTLFMKWFLRAGHDGLRRCGVVSSRSRTDPATRETSS